METIKVEGMHRLQGEVTIQGSKNAVLPILSACVLNKGETILYGCPKISDVFSMLELLESAGAKVKWEDHVLIMDTSEMKNVPLIEKAGCMRSSVMLLGSFLARFGKVVLGYPGGCCIGKRPIDLHEQSLSAMGVVFREKPEFLEAFCKNLEGCDIYLPYPSVGVTENLLLAAAGASGMTRIYGAAREPEIIELCRFLLAMGIRVYGIGTEKLFVMGGKCKRHVTYKICPDRIVAGTYLLAVAGTGGEVVLKNAPLEHMRSTMVTLGHLGAVFYRSGNDVKIQMKRKPKALPYVYTSPYPGFPTDLQSPLLSVLCRAEGKSCIEENVFENRFLVVEELRKMGANIEVRGKKAYISGIAKMKGSHLQVKDLRGGAALVLAALQAEDISVITPMEIILRGYENLDGDLEKIGARIQRIS